MPTGQISQTPVLRKYRTLAAIQRNFIMSEGEILNTIKSVKGVSLIQLIGLFPEEPTIIMEDHLESLINSGLITLFKEKYYPICRSIGKFHKGKNEMVELIEIEVFTVEKLKTVFTPNEDDPLFYDGYLIDSTKSILFQTINAVRFNFEQFDYYLLCQFDN